MKKTIIFFTAIFLASSCLGQSLDGFYYLDCSNVNEIGTGYYKFSKNKFLFFNIKQSPTPDKPYMIDAVGTGTYTMNSNKVVFSFMADTNLVNVNVYDSIGMSFYSLKEQKDTKITFNVHFRLEDYLGTSLIVQTNNGKEYHKGVQGTDSTIVITIPGNELIKSIKIYKVGYSERVLPVDYYFNNLKYDYYFKDYHNFIKIIDTGKIELTIKFTMGMSFRFEHSAYLHKRENKDIERLSDLLNEVKQLKAILTKKF